MGEGVTLKKEREEGVIEEDQKDRGLKGNRRRR